MWRKQPLNTQHDCDLVALRSHPYNCRHFRPTFVGAKHQTQRLSVKVGFCSWWRHSDVKQIRSNRESQRVSPIRLRVIRHHAYRVSIDSALAGERGAVSHAMCAVMISCQPCEPNSLSPQASCACMRTLLEQHSAITSRCRYIQAFRERRGVWCWLHVASMCAQGARVCTPRRTFQCGHTMP